MLPTRTMLGTVDSGLTEKLTVFVGFGGLTGTNMTRRGSVDGGGRIAKAGKSVLSGSWSAGFSRP